MYHYANRPGLSTQTSRQVIAQFYNTSVNGLPGNDGMSLSSSYCLELPFMCLFFGLDSGENIVICASLEMNN